MPTLLGITPSTLTDGVIYSDAVPITSTESNLYGGTGVQSTNPIATQFGEAIIAIILLNANGIVTANNTYIVLQQDLGDGNWVDINWCVWNGKQGTALFVFSNGVAGANTVEQSRQSGSSPTPQANGSNQLCLGGRLRFVGKTILSGGSSSIQGVVNQVTATIRYKLLALR